MLQTAVQPQAPPLPAYVQIEPVGQCNLRCQMCPIQFGPPYGPPAFMPFDTFVRLVDQFEGLAHLHLQGLGEPMMHPRFFDMVAYAARREIKVTTNTNLTLLNPRRAEAAVASGLDTIHVSVDGATPETYERIRVRGHFDRLARNVALLLETRARLCSETPHLHLVAVVMRQNLHELPALVELAARWGAEQLFVQHLAHDFQEPTLPPEYRSMQEFVQEETLLHEDPTRIERFFAHARRIATDRGLDLRLPRPRPRLHPPGTPGRDRCDWPWSGAYISYQGYAMPCCMIATPDRMHFGNMADAGVGPVWTNPAYQQFRAQLDSAQPPQLCRSCSLYHGVF